MNKIIFIIGMRRSGTSILRSLIMQHPKVENIEFEPNELFEITERIDIARYRNNKFYNATLDRFRRDESYYGAKLAVNPGIEAMRWKNLIKKFPEAKFIFIKRNATNTYKSWVYNETSERGVCSYELYKPWWDFINKSFLDFSMYNPSKAVVLDYEDILKTPDKELQKVWKLLKIKSDIPSVKSLIHKPKWGSNG